MDRLQIEEIFTYHSPQGDQPQRYEAIRAKAKGLATTIIENTAPSADQTAAIRKLRESVMTANASIALENTRAGGEWPGFAPKPVGPFTALDVAVVCHEANRALCLVMGDDSQKPWNDAEEWQRTSAVGGVRFVLDNPYAPASANHESWLKEKEQTGWVFGPVKDADLKQHPCMVPYHELPREQQAQDHLFKAIVEGLRGFIVEASLEATAA